MNNIPVGETAFSGFQVMARKPLALLAWAALVFVLGIVPMMAVFSLMGPWLAEISRAINAGTAPDAQAMMAMQMRMMTLNPLVMLASLASRTLLACAVYRAVLTPQDDRFAYLRLGKAELLVGLVYLCLVILMYLAAGAGALVVVALSVAASAASKAVAVGLGILLGLALVITLVWLWLRLSMALPMTFVERKFRFFEAWGFTRGRAWNLFAIGLLVIVIVWIAEMVVAAIGAAVLLSLMPSLLADQLGFLGLFTRPMGQIAPWLVLAGVIGSVLSAVFYTVLFAPWAAAYRAMAPVASGDAVEA